MPHLVSKQTWGTIDFDSDTGRIFVREDWLYSWKLWPGAAKAWTYREKRTAHSLIDRSVWAIWSNRLALNVRSRTGPPPRFGVRAPVNFDVRWTLHKGDWAVTVWTMPPGAGPTLHRSFVMPSQQRIELNTADLRFRSAGNQAGAWNPHFVTPPHEFAHTMDNPDEYNTGSPFLADSASLVNIGREVRARHLHLLVDALNALVPKLEFSA